MDGEFWSLGDVPVIFADTLERLEACSCLAEDAVACALDAEWPPGLSGSLISASLVQLALWSPPHGLQVVLLDMLALPKHAAKQFLQHIFRNKDTLKVGYSIVQDLRAVAAALGPEGGGCIAVLEPCLDAGTLHRHLLKHRAPGLRRAASPGLSGIVEAQLGAPLDKSLQCSAWGCRPLSPQQLSYAAADAACLLALLSDFVQRAPPETYPLGGSGAELEQALGGRVQSGITSGEIGNAGSLDAEEAEEEQGEGETESEQEERLHHSSSGGSSSGGGGSKRTAAAAPESATPSSQGAQGGWLACGAHGVRQAAEWWGSRLEVSGGRALKQRLPRRTRAKLRKAEGEDDAAHAFPAHVPWMDARKQLVGEPRFLCDVMTEGLARQLRMVGIDAEALPPRDKTQRYAVYRQMVERAESEGRVVLTKDLTFMAAGYTYQAYLVRAATKQAQLQEILRVFGLTVRQDDLLSRCGRCNGEFIPTPFPPDKLPPGHDVPEGIRRQHSEFWVCSRCSWVFWQGNQYGHALERISGMLEAMAVK